MRAAVAFVVLVSLAGASVADPPAALSPEDPLLFSVPTQGPAAGRGRVETAVAYGARTTRAFGDHAREGRVTAEAALTSRISLAAGAGLATDARGDSLGKSVSAELRGQIVRGVRAGVGVAHDYLGRDLLTLRAAVGGSVGPVALSGEGELDLHPRADARTRERADVTLSAAAAIRVTRTLQAALELTGSDLEGFADASEAEGGARIAVGPTLIAHVTRQLYLRASLATLFYATRNTPVAGPASTEKQGVLADLALGWQF